MINFTENFEKLVQLQQEALAPLRVFSGVAVDSAEKIARKNYAVCGDVLEYAIAQAKLPADVTEPKDLFERQAEATRQFAELLTQRANEYVELGKTFQASATEVINEDFIKPVKKAAAAAPKKAA